MRDVDGLILSKQDVSQGFERDEKNRQYKESKYHRSVQNGNPLKIFDSSKSNIMHSEFPLLKPIFIETKPPFFFYPIEAYWN